MSANPLDPTHDAIDISGLTDDEVYQVVKRMDSQAYQMREYWHFGRHPLFKIAADYVLMQYHGKLYKSPKGQFHPDVKADLKANWRPAGQDERNWFCNNL